MPFCPEEESGGGGMGEERRRRDGEEESKRGARWGEPRAFGTPIGFDRWADERAAIPSAPGDPQLPS
jgi:hypothetical protein